MSQPFRLMSYNPQWDQEYEQARSSILQATAGCICAIEHIGATALPGAVARPVIDLIAGLNEMQELSEACELIEGLNYKRVETPAWADEELCALLLKPRSGEATHSVLLVRHEKPVWRLALWVRDFLRSNRETAEELSELKKNHFQIQKHQ